MSTFLKIAQDVDRLIGTQGEVTSLSVLGYHATLAEHIRVAWISIQTLRKDWQFMREDVDISLVLGKDVYTPFDIFGTTDSRVAKWREDLILYDKDSIPVIDYDRYLQETWDDTTTEPRKMTIHPVNGSVIFNSVDMGYTINAHYYRKPQILIDNTDIVILPEEFMLVLVYKACASLGMFLGVPETFQDYTIKYDLEMGAMMRSLNPSKRVRSRGVA